MLAAVRRQQPAATLRRDHPFGGRVPISGQTDATGPGDNTPRIMRTTGAVSHAGPSDQHPQHRGHEEGNGGSVLSVEEMVDNVREAGLTIDLRNQDLPAVPELVLASARRIVQEALTNSIRHAPDSARCRVELSTDGEQMVIEVVNSAQPDHAMSRRARSARHVAARRAAQRLARGRPTRRGRFPGVRPVALRGRGPLMNCEDIRVLVTDDEALLRGSFRLLIDGTRGMTVVGEAVKR